MRNEWLIAGIILACIIVGAAFISDQAVGQKLKFIMQGTAGPFALDTLMPYSPATAPIYKVIAKDAIFQGDPKSPSTKSNAPSVVEAPALAEEALEQYGGLPKDAVLYTVVQDTVEKYNTKTGTVEEKKAIATRVIYRQQLDDRPVIGAGINIKLGENGEVLSIHKGWRTVEYAGEVPIITSDEAYDKLKKGESLVINQASAMDLRVTDIKLGYYAEDISKDQEYYKPVWLFYAAQKGQAPIPYPVDAMKK